MRPRSSQRLALIALAGAVALGIALRLVWPSDMEYKADERYLFHHATGPNPFPWIGQPSGVGTPNPGMGIWIYSLMAHGLALHTPVALVRGVMVLNVLALLALLVFALRVIPARRREPWLWATALLAVNPLAVLFSRKLWIQSALPPFVMAAVAAWWWRGRRAGALAWGLTGAWLGQIHMTGFFFAAGVAAWTGLYDRASVRWRWWLAGSLAGAATLVPWLVHVLTHAGTPARSVVHTAAPLFFVYWISYPLSFNLFTSFGSDSWKLLAWPSLDGTALHLVTLTFVVIALAGAAIWIDALARAWRAVRTRPRSLRPRRPRSDTGLLVRGGLWGYGLLLSASGVLVYRHYLIVALVLPFLAIGLAALRRRRHGRQLLAVLVLASAALSIQYLTYIHAHGGARGGDYGVAYDAQPAARR